MQDALFNLVTVWTHQSILLTGMLTEAIHTPFMQDRYLSIENAKYIFNNCRHLGDEVEFKEGGIIQSRAQNVLRKADELLEEVEKEGLFSTIAVSYTHLYCRHCTRRRLAGETDGSRSREDIDACIDYIRRTPQVRDVLLSGGDCLCVEDDTLEYIISELRKIPHVEIVRLGSRTPVVMPMRITDKLVNMLKKYHPIWLNTHFNHPKRCV